MPSSWKKALKARLPKSWWRTARRLVRGPIYAGNFRSWSAAVAASSGYADPAIFEKTLAAACAVRDGHALWERDSVLFHTPARHEPLLDALRYVANAHGGRLRLLDFGGAFGSLWWQHRTWLMDLRETRWSIVEQAHIVAAGRKEFTTGPLRFFATIAECCAAEQPDVILLAGVLPYLESPHQLLAEIRQRDFRHVIIDRTGFVTSGPDRLTIQHVPPEIYRASYPCWFLNREALVKSFAPDWAVVKEWENADDVDIAAEHRGLVFEKRQQ